MSLSPGADAGGASGDAAPEAGDDPYARAWGALNKLIRRGHSWSGREHNCAYLNLGNGAFANVSATSGFDFADDARALATTDFDLDGRPELLVTNRTTPRVRLLRPTASDGRRAVALRLRSSGRNRDAIGARVELVLRASGDPESSAAGATRIVRAVRAGEGYLAQSSAWLAIGLGDAHVERALVTWPGGEEESFVGIDDARAYVLEQGTGRAFEFVRAPAKHPLASPSRAVEARRVHDEYGQRVVLAQPIPLPNLVVRPSTGGELALFGVRPNGDGSGTGRAVLLNLWSESCAPCVGELSEFAARLGELDAAGLAFLALNVDAPDAPVADDEHPGATLMRKLEWPYAWASAPGITVETLDVLLGVILDTQERLPLPSSFLVDADGFLRVVYTGRVRPEQLLRDVERLRLPRDEWLDQAIPFAGIWHREPARALAALEPRFAARGLEDVAREYGRTAFAVVTKTRAEMLHEFGREYAAQGNTAGALDAFRKAVDEDPEYFQARFDLGVLLQRDGQLHDAISAYVSALRIEPDHIDANFNLALAYIGTRQLRSAERQVERLRELGSSLAEELVPFLEKLREDRESR